ncbi:MAG: Holliday junction resolvase RuvX [Acidimicrobiia bacterium]|nr:Holliday junction resolvase RuvX [Acidimicrobiia bacterium]
MRVVAFDLGTRRIGVAASDPGGILASPVAVVERSGDDEADRRELARLVDELGAGHVVVGLPLSLDGSRGPAAEDARVRIEALADLLDVPVEPYDERFTTVTAEQRLRERGLDGRRRRRVVDAAAAAVLLQAWLDARAVPPVPEPTTPTT